MRYLYSIFVLVFLFPGNVFAQYTIEKDHAPFYSSHKMPGLFPDRKTAEPTLKLLAIFGQGTLMYSTGEVRKVGDVHLGMVLVPVWIPVEQLSQVDPGIKSLREDPKKSVSKQLGSVDRGED